ncbi:hypothetical protein AX774_g671 [Zancudomyces culisetae]|uniref:RNA exonuclease 1 homolog-like domain-containing protein n=1 Tax=Zancudomyces culisetae TaxID=1213189 RepID=A0A1R1PXS1_ZANCU|nr:hypothetical protein AX774_g671 [Zancudomyces culisetae]|eukprot:OMH85774.1 hypothetical protein AX774_g671 [Zancudomyces culisetae]
MQNTQQKPIYMPKTSTPKPDSVRSIQTAKETIVILNNTKNIEHKDAAKYHVDEPKVAIKTDLSKKNDQNSEKEQPGVKRQVNQSDKHLQSKKCPVIKAEVNQRIPWELRQKTLELIFKEFERIYKSNTNVDISDIALLKEKELYLKSNPKTYRNTISLELSRLKKQTKPEILKRDIDIATEKEKPKDTHEADRKVEYRQININANDPNVFEKLLSMTLTKQKLELMDYPLPKVIYAETIRTKSLDLSHKADSTPGDKLIKGQSRRCNQDNANYGRLKPTALVGTRTRCYKCQKVFTIQLPTKNPSVLTECLFHHGKLLARNPLVGERISSGRTYSCCGGDTSSNPCDVGPHSFVSDSDGLNHALVPYRFSEKVDDRSSRHALLALDCEMVNTPIYVCYMLS